MTTDLGWIAQLPDAVPHRSMAAALGKYLQSATRGPQRAPGRRLRLADAKRRDLALLGRRLKPALRTYISLVGPETIMVWYRRLVKRGRGHTYEHELSICRVASCLSPYGAGLGIRRDGANSVTGRAFDDRLSSTPFGRILRV